MSTMNQPEVMVTVTSPWLDANSLVAPLGRFTRTPARAP